MSVYVTGDLHGDMDIRKLGTRNFSEGRNLTKDDYVIVAGDFGLVWDVNESGQSEQYWIDWLSNKKWTTLFVDGNHENFDRINALPQVELFDGKAGMLTKSIFHLKRGEIYNINGSKFFTFGGAYSIDKARRKSFISWWPQEEPNKAEMDWGLENLERHNNEVDYVVTHTAPTEVIKEMSEYRLNFYDDYYIMKMDSCSKYLSEVKKRIKFKKWYFGHFHDNGELDDGFHVLYHDIIKVL